MIGFIRFMVDSHAGPLGFIPQGFIRAGCCKA